MSLKFSSRYGEEYIVGKLLHRADATGERIPLQHCEEDMLVFYPNIEYEGLPFKAKCTVCPQEYHAKEAIDLWQMTVTQ